MHLETNSLLDSDVEVALPNARRSGVSKLKPKLWYIEYYVPFVSWMRNYSIDSLPGDICAGLTLASFQIPVALSYAQTLAHVAPICGLHGLIIPPLVYALFGRVPAMVVAPEAPISLVVGQAVSFYNKMPPKVPGHHGDDDDFSTSEMPAVICACAGGIILAAGLMRLGFLTHILSQSLLRGFITGVGFVMVADQLLSQTGLANGTDLPQSASPLEQVVYVFTHLDSIHVPTAMLAFGGLAVILLLGSLKSRLAKRGFHSAVVFPEILLVVILSTLICGYGRLDEQGIDIIGKIKPGKTQFVWPLQRKYWPPLRSTFLTCLFVAILGVLESTVAAQALNPEDLSTSSNRELVALGIVNLAAMTTNALPSFGGYGRSKINKLCGARTQMASVVLALASLLTMWKLLDLIYYLPKCILSTVITKIGLTLIGEAPRDIKFYFKVRGYSDLATILLSVLATFFWSVEAGVGMGMSVTLVRVIHHASRPRIQILTKLPGSREYVNADDLDHDGATREAANSGTLLVHIAEPLTFANSGDLKNRLRRLEHHGTDKVHPNRPPTRARELLHVVFDCKGMTRCDPTAAAIFHGICRSLLARKVMVLVCDLPARRQVQMLLKDAGVIDLLNSQQRGRVFFESIEEAMASFERLD